MNEKNQLSTIDTKEITGAVKEKYFNSLLTEVNDHVVKLSVMHEPYFWHKHPNSDESFFVLEGQLLIELEDALVTLSPGQLFTIPKNMIHKTSPVNGRSVNLSFESHDIETVEVTF